MDTLINGLSPQVVLPRPQGVSSVPASAPPPVADKVGTAGESSMVAETQGGEAVEGAVASIQSFVQSIRRDLNFSLDESSGRVVVKVTDRESGEVIRQLPSEEALRLAESLEEVRSLLFKAEA